MSCRMYVPNWGLLSTIVTAILVRVETCSEIGPNHDQWFGDYICLLESEEKLARVF